VLVRELFAPSARFVPPLPSWTYALIGIPGLTPAVKKSILSFFFLCLSWLLDLGPMPGQKSQCYDPGQCSGNGTRGPLIRQEAEQTCAGGGTTKDAGKEQGTKEESAPGLQGSGAKRKGLGLGL
jgi:hypothetical protein